MDLTTSYMGLTLKNPLVASASPLSESAGHDPAPRRSRRGGGRHVLALRRTDPARQGRAGAFHGARARDSFGEALSYLPEVAELRRRAGAVSGADAEGERAVDIPIIASLNGVTERAGSISPEQMQEAGAKGHRAEHLLHPDRDGSHRQRKSSSSTSTSLGAVKAAVTIPVAMKVGPYFSSFAHMAGQLDAAGADALVLFNRFYQPDFDIETRTVVPSLALSTPRGDPAAAAVDRAAARTGEGVARRDDRRAQRVEAIKYLMAGADVVMSTSAAAAAGPGVSLARSWPTCPAGWRGRATSRSRSCAAR